jgi:hypothetical protein
MATANLQVEEHRKLVDKLLHSKEFQRADRLRELLEYLFEQSLLPDSPELKERDIGNAVYGRSTDYNPAEDSIARVEVRNLRKRLAGYFEAEGTDEPTIIDIPKGHYRLRFSVRPATPVPHRAGRNRFRLQLGLAFVGGLLLGLAALLLAPGVSREVPMSVSAPIWSHFAGNARPTYIVLADSVWAEMQYLLKRELTLEDYLDKGPRGHPLPDKWAGLEEEVGHLFTRPYTSIADVTFVERLMNQSALAQWTPSVRLARDMGARDFKGNNIVLLGSKRSNPWVELFDEQMNFVFEFDEERERPLIRNRLPKPGEPGAYVAGAGSSTSSDVYGHIALVPNLDNSGMVLLVQGTYAEGTEAVAELLTNYEACSAIVSDLNLEVGGALRPFELVVKSTVIEGTSQGSEVVAHRLLDREP